MTTTTLKRSCAALAATLCMTISAGAYASKPSQALLDFVAEAAAQSVSQSALTPQTGVIGPVRQAEVLPVPDVVVAPVVPPTITPNITPGGTTNLLPPVRPPFRPTIRSPFTP